ncbi:hypothetical protein BJV74DRAFT_485306 [Russula compacta]|nr:hypothetical protein BJV74DRAFT_485306 [Russula compacta]
MASSAIYPPSTTLPSWEYGGYPYDDHRPEYTPYTSSRPLRRHSQHHQVYQVWMPPRYSTGSYPDSPGHPSPPLRHSLTNDPAFALDPGINPDYLYRQMDAQLTIPFPARSYSGLDLPPGFVPQPGPVPNTSYRAHSYHEDLARQSSVPQSFYSHPSVSSSSSGSDSSSSSIARPPLSLVRSSSNTHEHSDSHLRLIPPMEAPYAPPDEPANDQAEASGAMVPFPADRNSHSVMSSMMGSGSLPPSLSEQSNDSRGRTSSTSRPTLDLDSIDELDETNPHGFNVHHRGPYEAVAAILNDTAPVDSPLLRVKGVQQQLSASGRLRPSMRVKSEPNANPMSLNLQPGQILQGSIYLPTQPSHFPPEFSLGARPPNRDIRPAPGPVEFTTAGNDAARSPLRRNQTLPAASLARGPSEVQGYQHAYPATSNSNVHQSSRPSPYPVDSQNNVPPRPSGVDHGTTRRPPYADTSLNTRLPSQLAPVAPVVPPEAPPTPDIDLRLSRTLYLTNPDENLGTPDHRLRTSSLPPAQRWFIHWDRAIDEQRSLRVVSATTLTMASLCPRLHTLLRTQELAGKVPCVQQQ